jgi:hypothetical protein
MVQSGIELGAPGLPVSGPAAECQYVRWREFSVSKHLALILLTLGCWLVDPWPSERLLRELQQIDPRLSDLAIQSAKRFECRPSGRKLELLLTPHEQTALHTQQFEISCEYDSDEHWNCSDPEELMFLRSQEGFSDIRISGDISPEKAAAAIALVRGEIRERFLYFKNSKLSGDDIGSPVKIRPVDSTIDSGTWKSDLLDNCTYVIYTENDFSLCVPDQLIDSDRDIAVFGTMVLSYHLCYEVASPDI